jgi:hypothetical protein
MEAIHGPRAIGIKLIRRKRETSGNSRLNNWQNKIQMLSKWIIYTLSVAVCNTDEIAKNFKHPTYEQTRAARKPTRKRKEKHNKKNRRHRHRA